MMQGLNPNGKLQMVKVDADGKLVVTGVAGGGGGGGGSSDTTEATQLLVKGAVEAINTKTPALSGGKVPVTNPTALPLPQGAAAEATQTLIATAVQSLDAKTPALGTVQEVEVLDAPGAVTYAPGVDVSLPAEWDLSSVGAGAIAHVEVTAGQRVLALTLDPSVAGQTAIAKRVAGVRSPASVRAALSMSQRTRQDAAGLAVYDATTVLPSATTYTISTLQQAGTTLTVVLTTPFTGVLGDAICISGVPDNRLCCQDAPVASISADGLTLTITTQSGATIPSLTVGPVSGGVLTHAADPIARSANGGALSFTSATTTLAEIYARRGGATRYGSGAVAATTADRRLTAATSAILRAVGVAGVQLLPSSEYRMDIEPGGIEFLDRSTDSTAVFSTRAYVATGAPASARDLRIALLASRSVAAAAVNANIVSISRAANVVTVTLDRTAASAGVAVGTYPHVFGVLSAGLFPNTVFSSPVSGVSGNTFTVSWAGTDGTSYGGVVSMPAGGNALTPANNVTAVAVEASGRVNLTAAASWAGVAALDVVYVSARHGTTGADLGIAGLWTVNSVSGVTLTLAPLLDHAGVRRSPTPAVLASTTAGGTVILATTIRAHSLTAASADAVQVRIAGAGTASLPQSVPAYVTGGIVNVAQSTPLSATGGTLGWPVAQGLQQLQVVASSALTATATAGGFALAGNSGGATAMTVVIGVTAVSGTVPTLDCRIEVQDDAARWYPLYDFARITTAGTYSSPELRVDGRAWRLVQTVGGTSPSFTRVVTHNLLPFQQARHLAQMIDRTVSLTTLGAATPALYADGPADLHLVVNIGAATTPPALQLQVSEDNGATWVSVGSPVTAVVSGTVKAKAPGEYARHARAVVTTAGAGVTAGYVLLKAAG